MISIIFVIIGLSLLVLVHEWGHFLAARYFGLLVEEFGIGFPPRLIKKKIGETLYSLNAIPLGGFVKIYGENASSAGNFNHPEKSFAHQLPWKRAVIISAGVLMNFIFGWLIISFVFFIGSPSLILVDLVKESGPAFAAGIRQGDRILGWEKADDLVDYININQGREIDLAVIRDGEEISFTAKPRLNPPVGEGALGIGLRDSGIPKHGFFSALGNGFVASAAIIGAVFYGLYQAVFSPENVLGPVGIFGAAVDTGELGIIYLFQFLALISLNLVVLNILPIPILDGGRLLFIIMEKIRGKRLSLETENRANALGLAFLLTLIVLITIKDVAGLL